jgi:hypothetical protein
MGFVVDKVALGQVFSEYFLNVIGKRVSYFILYLLIATMNNINPSLNITY